MPEILEQRGFVPAKDFARSIDFYTRMGWSNIYKDDSLALMKLGASLFFVQKAWVEDWAHNTMIHLVVDDAAAWYETAMRVKAAGGFDEVRIGAPRRETYGALATHVIDPAGVLLFFAQFDQA
jgi:catechol 2,3-dioxygenase-like lactoylglutathione lyase family enzyme